MPAHEQEHEASDSLRIQVSTARVAAKTTVKTVKAAASVAEAPVAVAKKTVKIVSFAANAPSRVRAFAKSDGKTKGRILLGLGKKAGKRVGRTALGVSQGVIRGSAKVADAGINRFFDLQTADGDETTQVAVEEASRGLTLAKGSVKAAGKTLTHSKRSIRAASRSFKAARKSFKAAKQSLDAARAAMHSAASAMQALKAIGSIIAAVVTMVVNTVTSVIAVLAPIIAIFIAVTMVISFIVNFLTITSQQASAACVGDSSYTINSAGFNAKSGALTGLIYHSSGGTKVVDFMKMGIPASKYDNDPWSYAYQQCTWWAAYRRKMLGQPVDKQMGNGNQWASSAKTKGYKTGTSPRLGAVISYPSGVLGASPAYGHVSVVEQIDPNGDIWVSQAGTGFFSTYGGPVVSKISKRQLEENKTLTFIYDSTGSGNGLAVQGTQTDLNSDDCDVPAPPAGNVGKEVTAAKNYAKGRLSAYGWKESEFNALDQLWTHESGWKWDADNPTSDAYGIPQALPGNKMSSKGADWKTNPKTQIEWGLQYIKDRYKTPSAAWRQWQSRSPNWY